MVTTAMTARLLIGHQLRSLSEIDWTVVSGDAYDDPPPAVHVHVVPIRRELALSDLSGFRALYRWLRRQRFDLVQTHTPKASILGLPAARLSGARTVYTMHGALYFADNGRLANLAGWVFERWCCSWAHHVLVQSREDEQVLPRVGICRRSKVVHVGNGIQLERFIDPGPPAADLGPGPVVVMVARLVREKGCADFLTLARRLAGKAQFVHVGPREADQRDALSTEEIEAAERDGTVRFVGAVDDVRPYLAAADVVVLPSYREGIPRAAMEAAAAGVPVAAYDIRGVREVLGRDSGLLARRGDVDGLVDIVSGLLQEPERRVALGRRCRERVVSEFSEEAVIDRLRRFYASIPAARR